jgi:hypothetical protein
LIFLLENIEDSRIFVSSLAKKKPSNLEFLSIASIFGVGLKEPYINRINIPSNGCIQPHFNKRIVIAIAFILLSLEIKGADWRMMRNLFKRYADTSHHTLISLANDRVERFFNVGANGCCEGNCLSHVSDLFCDVLLLGS